MGDDKKMATTKSKPINLEVMELNVKFENAKNQNKLEDVLPNGCWKQEGYSYWDDPNQIMLPYEFSRPLTREEVTRITQKLYDMGNDIRNWSFKKYTKT